MKSFIKTPEKFPLPAYLQEFCKIFQTRYSVEHLLQVASDALWPISGQCSLLILPRKEKLVCCMTRALLLLLIFLYHLTVLSLFFWSYKRTLADEITTLALTICCSSGLHSELPGYVKNMEQSIINLNWYYMLNLNHPNASLALAHVTISKQKVATIISQSVPLETNIVKFF